jgi:hypothetical protein
MRTSRGDGRSGTTKGHRNGTRNREGETKEGGRRKDRSASSLGARLSDKAIKSLTVQVEVGQDSAGKGRDVVSWGSRMEGIRVFTQAIDRN